MKEILEAIARGYAVLIQPHSSGISIRIFEGNDLNGKQYGKAVSADEEQLALALRNMPKVWEQDSAKGGR